MSIEIGIILVAAVVIVILWIMYKAGKDEISRLEHAHRSEKESLNKRVESAEAARDEKLKQLSNMQSRYDAIHQQYVRLMRAYMLSRKVNEAEAIAQIEEAVRSDYEALGSQHIPATNYIASAMADYYTASLREAEQTLLKSGQRSRSERIADLRERAAQLVERAKRSQYAFEAALIRILKEHPELRSEYDVQQYGIPLDETPEIAPPGQEKLTEYKQQISSYKKHVDRRWPLLRDSVEAYQKEFASNLTAIPYMSRIIADIMTVDLDRLAWSLSWGNNQERRKKVAAINALKKEKAEEIERLKGAEYQLAYLLELYPALQDVLDTEFQELRVSYDAPTDIDPARKYIEREEWEALSEGERNQLALDRYVESRSKTKWQIGRDYELYCGYCYEQDGYTVDYFGSAHGLEDLGRDLIVKKNGETTIVQCKYWSRTKQIHENHIMQLYGSVIEYNLENNARATGILMTNTVLSDKAKEFARVLGIAYQEQVPLGEFPRIKCNIGTDMYGQQTRIYHLPFDQQYDATKVDGEGEFMALTVAEAEAAGFRRAYRWHGTE